jgi:hypothetical protein
MREAQHADEVAALWPLVIARAASNVASSEHQARLEPDDEYVQGSVSDDWRIWRAVRSVPWHAAHGQLALIGRGRDRSPSPFHWTSAWLLSSTPSTYTGFAWGATNTKQKTTKHNEQRNKGRAFVSYLNNKMKKNYLV